MRERFDQYQDDWDKPPPSCEEDRAARWEAIFGPGVIERPAAWDEIGGSREEET